MKRVVSKEELKLKSQNGFYSILSGEHESTEFGSGLEFADIIEYSSNHSARHINWKRSTISSTPYVNIFNETKELNIVIVLALSGSILFKNKLNIARDAFASLALAGSNENLKLITFTNKLEAIYNPRGNDSFEIAYEIATQKELLGIEAHYKKLISFLSANIEKKSLIFIISDFLEDIDFSSLAFKHKLYAIIIRDSNEEKITPLGERLFLDLSSGIKSKLNITQSSAKRYNNKFKKFDKKLQKNFIKNEIEFVKIYSQNEVIYKLKELLKVV